MSGKNAKFLRETDAASAACILLLNVCVLTATFSIGWLAYQLIKQSTPQLESFLRAVQMN